MARKAWIFVLVSLAFIIDPSEAAWKFWKNKNKDKDGSSENPLDDASSTSTTTTTLAPTTAKLLPSDVQSTTTSWKFWKKNKDSTTQAPSTTTTRRTIVMVTPANANRGIAAAGDPALAVGVGKDVRNVPRKPGPGTEVGLDIGLPKPVRPGLGPGSSGQGYRDWAADFAGAGDPARPKPKLPEQGPALSPGDGRPNQGNRPASVPSGASSGPAAKPDGRPASLPGSPTGQKTPTPTGNQGTGAKATPATTSTTTAPASRPSSTTPTPKAKPTLAPQPSYPALNPGGGGGASTPVSPTGSKTWAEIAGGGGNSRPGSPTPAPKTGSPTPAPKIGGSPTAQKRGEQDPFKYPGSQPGRPGVSPGAAAAAGGAALAGGTATGAALGKTYSSNPTYSKGKGVTDEDLEKLSEALFIKDNNNAYKYIKLNLQKTTSGSNPKDEAPQPLLEVKPEALQIPTIQKVLTIYDNYKPDTRENEYISPAQRQEESVLIDTFLSTNVMSAAMRFLADKGFVRKDYYDYKDTLRTLWFNLYSRGDGKIGSTGFEHVFLTELKLGTEVSGLHNWIYFNAEELKKKLDYLGYIKKVDLGDKAAIVKAHIKFDGVDKPVTNIFIGTSPELEMALYTVCFYARPDAKCPVSLGGTKFDILTHKFRYRGRDLIGSAYPDI